MGKQLLQQRHLDKLCTQLADFWRNCQRSQQQLWHDYYTSIVLKVFSCASVQVHSFLCKEETKTCYVYENVADTQICLSIHDTAESAPRYIYKLCMYVCTYIRTILVSRSQPTISYWLCLYNTNVHGLGTLSMFRYIGPLVKFRPLRLLACIVITAILGLG